MKINYKEMAVVGSCPFCGKPFKVAVNAEDFIDWQDGVSVQSAFPYLDANERESLISGICSKCWDNMFSE